MQTEISASAALPLRVTANGIEIAWPAIAADV
jgi:hypothetical protein